KKGRGTCPAPFASYWSVQLHDPAEIVLQLAILDAGECIVELLGDGADLAVVDDELLAVPAQRAHRGNHGGGAGAEGLVEAAGVGGVEDLLNVDTALLGLIAEVFGQLEDGIAGDAGEDGAVEHRGDD